MTFEELKSKSRWTYGDLLKTTEWKTKRAEILSIDKGKCTNCNNSNIYKDLSSGIVKSLTTDSDVLEIMIGKDYVESQPFHTNSIFIVDTLTNITLQKSFYSTTRINCSEIPRNPNIIVEYYKLDKNDLFQSFLFHRIYDKNLNQTIWKNERYEECSLHIHHRYYKVGQLPWNYPKDALITLCRYCHYNLHSGSKVPVFGRETVLTFCDKCGGEGWLPHFSYYKEGKCFRCNTACYYELMDVNIKSEYFK